MAALYAGAKIADRTGRKWLGWAAGILIFFVLVAIGSAAFDGLRFASCRAASDFGECVEAIRS